MSDITNNRLDDIDTDECCAAAALQLPQALQGHSRSSLAPRDKMLTAWTPLWHIPVTFTHPHNCMAVKLPACIGKRHTSSASAPRDLMLTV